jgi:MFS family permease
MGGLVFIATDTVIPAMMQSLGAPVWLISLIPVMAMIGFGWPSLLTAHYVERLHTVKPFIVLTGAFQRLPYLLAGFALIFLYDPMPKMVLFFVALAPFISGSVGGTSVTAWFELISRIIPEKRRASSWAVRNIIMSAIGIGAGAIIKTVLEKNPGATGYGILHLIATGFLAISFISFLCIREIIPEHSHAKIKSGFRENIKSVPKLFKENTMLLRYLISRIFANGLFIMLPFMAIQAIAKSGKGAGFVGVLVGAQMTGAILGNILAGIMGDRNGGKAPIVISRSFMVLVAGSMMFAAFSWHFIIIFFLLGMSLNLGLVGDGTLCLEICPSEKRPTFLAFLNTIGVMSMLLTATISTIIRNNFSSFVPFALLTLISLLISLWAIIPIKEPRNRMVSC